MKQIISKFTKKPENVVDTSEVRCPYKGCLFTSSRNGVQVHMKQVHQK